MRTIDSIEYHALFTPGLVGTVLDVGANKGIFAKQMVERFGVEVLALEANPALAADLRNQGFPVIECALGSSSGSTVLNVGENDETSSLLFREGGMLVVKDRIAVPMRTLEDVLADLGWPKLSCVKMDIEGGEIAVFKSLRTSPSQIAPQWTVEFHEAPQFRLSRPEEVGAVIDKMKRDGFSVLNRDRPGRMDVLFVDRNALKIGSLRWALIKLRYEWAGFLWRRLRGKR